MSTACTYTTFTDDRATLRALFPRRDPLPLATVVADRDVERYGPLVRRGWLTLAESWAVSGGKMATMTGEGRRGRGMRGKWEGDSGRNEATSH